MTESQEESRGINVRINKSKLLLFYGLFTFITNSVFRMSVTSVTGFRLPGHLGASNLPAIFCVCMMVILVFFQLKIGGTGKPQIKILYLSAVILFSCLVLISDRGDNSLRYWYMTENRSLGYWVLACSLLPGLLLMCFRYEEVQIETVFRYFLIVFNLVIEVIFIIGVADYYLGGTVNRFLADHLSDELWGEMIRTQNWDGFRMCTILGAPLMNAYYALAYIGMNLMYENLFGKCLTIKWKMYILGMVAIVITGSRVALIIGVTMILGSEYYRKWGFLKVFAFICFLVVVINTEIFQETVGTRFKLGFMSQNEARYQLLLAFYGRRFEKIYFFSGGGYNFSREMVVYLFSQSATMNFEFPLMMFLYDYGILGTVCYYLLYFGFPVFELLKMKQFYLAFIYGLVFMFLNSFNMLAQFYDANLELSFLIVMMLESCYMQKEKEIDALPG